MTMIYKPRYYQTNAIESAVNWIKTTTENGLIEAFQGAGKSNIIAEIAKIVRSISGKQVLCLVPSSELLKQNAEKFKLINEPVSLFSASAKSTSLRHSCVLATPMTVKNKLHKFKDQFSTVILDEADRSLTPTILSIIEHMRAHNPRLRVLGLTGTPFTMKSGYIYRTDVNDKPVSEGKTNDPFFAKQIFKIGRKELTDEGFLTPIVFGEISADRYDTSKLELNSMNRFDTKEVNKVFVGHGRRTASIVADVVARALNRNKVIFFAATVKHAEEILASLPVGISAMVSGNKASERDKVIRDYKSGKIRYIVNCEILTVGFDDPMTDTIAILRKTESSSLYLQIIGRGIRPIYAPGYPLDTREERLSAIENSCKKECLVLDYTSDNFDFHFPDHDIDNPQIKAYKNRSTGAEITATCPDCGTENTFSARKNDEGYQYNENGYFLDLMGNRITTEHGDMPSHYGRRCYGQELVSGKFERCNYFWSHKECPECGEKADITARYCPNKHELIDPNTRLIVSFQAKKNDPYQIQRDKVVAWETKKTLSKAGEEMFVVNFITEYRRFPAFYLTRRKEYAELMKVTQGGEVPPLSVTYRKDKESKFYRVLAYNQQVDQLGEIS